MVRKRAIRALWECCSCRGFSRAGDAVVAVLNRANDREDSMRNLVTKICGEMWFTDVSSFAGGQAPCDVLGAHAWHVSCAVHQGCRCLEHALSTSSAGSRA